jgi:type VI secretion system protein ImpJ
MDVRCHIDIDVPRESHVIALSKVLWSEGLFLRPQHLQCQDRHYEERLHAVARSVHPFPWGVRRVVAATLGAEADAVSLTSLDAVLPTGEHLQSPSPDNLPAPLSMNELTTKADTVIVSVTLPPVCADGGNCAMEGEAHRRYAARNVPVSDLFGSAASATIHFAMYAPRLVFDDDPSDNSSKLALLRLRRGATGRFEIDDTFIAPSISVGSSAPLVGRLSRLLGMLKSKASALMDEHAEPLRDTVAFRAGDHASFWLLHTVSSAAAALGHIKSVPGVSPEALHCELLRLAGGLMAFSRGKTLADLPDYVHASPHEGFRTLFDMVTDLIDTVIPTRFIPITLEKLGNAYLSGRIDAEKIDASATLYLGVSSGAAGQDIATTVPARFKIGAPDDVEKAVSSAIPCVRAKHVTAPPSAIPVKPGHTYFVLDARGAPYERMLSGGSVRIFTPSGTDDLKLEMFAVTS